MSLDNIKRIKDAEIIAKSIDDFLRSEGFTQGECGDAYSGVTGTTLFYKKLDSKQCEDNITVVVSDGEIGVEKDYSYGGGTSLGLWGDKDSRFSQDEDLFTEAYNSFIARLGELAKEYYLDLNN